MQEIGHVSCFSLANVWAPLLFSFVCTIQKSAIMVRSTLSLHSEKVCRTLGNRNKITPKSPRCILKSNGVQGGREWEFFTTHQSAVPQCPRIKTQHKRTWTQRHERLKPHFKQRSFLSSPWRQSNFQYNCLFYSHLIIKMTWLFCQISNARHVSTKTPNHKSPYRKPNPKNPKYLSTKWTGQKRLVLQSYPSLPLMKIACNQTY